eukprot:5841524-Prymnesium_polylepis.2
MCIRDRPCAQRRTANAHATNDLIAMLRMNPKVQNKRSTPASAEVMKNWEHHRTRGHTRGREDTREALRGRPLAALDGATVGARASPVDHKTQRLPELCSWGRHRC